MRKMEKLKKEREKILEEIKFLEDTELIRRYIKVKEKENKLEEEINELYKEIKFNEYDKCNHLIIYTGFDKTICKGCIKCGLEEQYRYYDYNCLSYNNKIMRDYLNQKGSMKGRIIKRTCNLELGKLIYSKLKEKNLAANEEMLINNFTFILDTMSDDNNYEIIDDKIKVLIKNNGGKR